MIVTLILSIFGIVGIFRVLSHLRNNSYRTTNMLKALINTFVVAFIFFFLLFSLKGCDSSYIASFVANPLPDLIAEDFESHQEINRIMDFKFNDEYKFNDSFLDWTSNAPEKLLTDKEVTLNRKQKQKADQLFKKVYRVVKNEISSGDRTRRFPETSQVKSAQEEKLKEAMKSAIISDVSISKMKADVSQGGSIFFSDVSQGGSISDTYRSSYFRCVEIVGDVVEQPKITPRIMDFIKRYDDENEVIRMTLNERDNGYRMPTDIYEYINGKNAFEDGYFYIAAEEFEKVIRVCKIKSIPVCYDLRRLLGSEAFKSVLSIEGATATETKIRDILKNLSSENTTY